MAKVRDKKINRIMGDPNEETKLAILNIYCDNELEQVFEMEYLEDLINPSDIHGLLRMVFYGYDYTPFDDNETQPFNPNRDYFKFNGYGNLVSISGYYVQDIIDENLKLKEVLECLEDYQLDEILEDFDIE